MKKSDLIALAIIALAAVNIAAFISIGFWALFLAGASVPLCNKLLTIILKLKGN